MSYKSSDEWAVALTWMVLPAGRAWQKAAGAALERFGVSLSVAAPILVVARMGNGVQQKVIAYEAGIDEAAVVRSVDQLERDGLLLRKPDPGDGRAKTIHLTPKGRGLVRKLDKVIRDLRDDLLREISQKDGMAAVRVLRELERGANRNLSGSIQPAEGNP
ncbi:MarR family winged helix-turn-helix transcriptional regulator [Granulicella cerasi]|uniref:MarR family winged helix-turn-helix transcriptional regulator n=1 Tax=Granulicella cerasi TaxID=741063 RepID=A0ABW1ZFY1_9BACT|nr:MarR family transcriptional regulator [Granulicella cerasi]